MKAEIQERLLREVVELGEKEAQSDGSNVRLSPKWQAEVITATFARRENSIDFNDILANAIDGQKGQAGEYKLASAWLAAWAATVWKLR